MINERTALFVYVSSFLSLSVIVFPYRVYRISGRCSDVIHPVIRIKSTAADDFRLLIFIAVGVCGDDFDVCVCLLQCVFEEMGAYGDVAVAVTATDIAAPDNAAVITYSPPVLTGGQAWMK